MGGEAVDWEQVSSVLGWPDIVVSSVGGAERVVALAAPRQDGTESVYEVSLPVPLAWVDRLELRSATPFFSRISRRTKAKPVVMASTETVWP